MNTINIYHGKKQVKTLNYHSKLNGLFIRNSIIKFYSYLLDTNKSVYFTISHEMLTTSIGTYIEPKHFIK